MMLKEILTGCAPKGAEAVVDAFHEIASIEYDESNPHAPIPPVLEKFKIDLVDANGESVQFPIRFVCDPSYHDPEIQPSFLPEENVKILYPTDFEQDSCGKQT